MVGWLYFEWMDVQMIGLTNGIQTHINQIAHVNLLFLMSSEGFKHHHVLQFYQFLIFTSTSSQ